MMHDFPYTDLHELNLDWFLGQFKNLKKLVEDLKKIVINAPDASSATAGQVLTADGTGGHYWGDVQGGDSVPTNVRQAIVTILTKALYNDTGLTDEKAILQSWATEVTDIAISQSAISISGASTKQLTATTTPVGGLVTWSSSDTSVATVSDTGLVAGVSNGTATITAFCGGKKATCTATVSGFATLTGITAVYSGGSVQEGTSLESLKSDLVVTASYDNSTTRTLSDSEYTLSGSLATEGEKTVTVTYGGKVATFTVTVTSNVLYSWDLTDSLVDSIGGVTAVTNATQDSTGLHFTQALKYIEFPVYAKDRTYEIDVDSMVRLQPNAYYGRLFVVNANSVTGTGGSGYILTGTQKGGDLFYMNGAWESSNVIVSQSDDADGSYYADSTIGFYIDADGFVSVYKDGELLGTSAGALASSYDGANVYIGSSSNSDTLNASTFTGFRVYAGNRYGGSQ